ncbi:hypothetical protein ACQ86D_26425 [Streptomyces galilaeus]
MEYPEIMQRVVAVLTQSGEWHRKLVEDVDREDFDSELGILGELLDGTLPPLELPADVTRDQLGPIFSQYLTGALAPLVSAFTQAHHALAEVHDAGRTDITSAEVLRELAVRIEANWPDS